MLDYIDTYLEVLNNSKNSFFFNPNLTNIKRFAKNASSENLTILYLQLVDKCWPGLKVRNLFRRRKVKRLYR